MLVKFDRLELGNEYHRKQLAALWQCKSWQAIGRGIVTPKKQKKIVLFVTKEKQESLTQYQDHFEGDRLYMEGETDHANDNRLVNAEHAGDEIHLFYRERHHMPFTYFGLLNLIEHSIQTDSPSKFVFKTTRLETITTSALTTEDLTHANGEEFIGDPEGRKRYLLQATYERSVRNRAEAIRIHGTQCKCCGFDFNKFYSPALARDFIEVHHVRSITRTDGIVNPQTDLVPLCSNCHSMAHRKTGEILSIMEIQSFMKGQGWTPPSLP